MREKGMTVNLITYNAGITALSKSSRQNARSARYNNNREDLPADGELWTRALILLGQMKEDGIEPDGFSYSAAISCCGAEGRWEEALELMDIMKRGGPRTRPNKISYTAAISACGQAGEAKRALALFQTMKDEGLSADRIAYNALFSALRVAGHADKTYELWGEICGTRSTSTRAIATAKDIATPDIITVTDCISTLATAERMSEVDEVFREAVQRGIVLRGNQLDSQWETDLSGMSFPVARAACRYILRQCLEEDSKNLQDVTFITGVGRAQQKPKGFHTSKQDVPSQKDVKISLREYVQDVLRNEFQPSVKSFVPERAQGTVQANKGSLVQWMNEQEAE
jgi:pentatricopeptide repeat protein